MTKTEIDRMIDTQIKKIEKLEEDAKSIKIAFEILKENVETQQMIGPGKINFETARNDIQKILNNYPSSHIAVSKICGYLRDMSFIKI